MRRIDGWQVSPSSSGKSFGETSNKEYGHFFEVPTAPSAPTYGVPALSARRYGGPSKHRPYDANVSPFDIQMLKGSKIVENSYSGSHQKENYPTRNMLGDSEKIQGTVKLYPESSHFQQQGSGAFNSGKPLMLNSRRDSIKTESLVNSRMLLDKREPSLTELATNLINSTNLPGNVPTKPRLDTADITKQTTPENSMFNMNRKNNLDWSRPSLTQSQTSNYSTASLLSPTRSIASWNRPYSNQNSADELMKSKSPMTVFGEKQSESNYNIEKTLSGTGEKINESSYISNRPTPSSSYVRDCSPPSLRGSSIRSSGHGSWHYNPSVRQTNYMNASDPYSSSSSKFDMYSNQSLSTSRSNPYSNGYGVAFSDGSHKNQPDRTSSVSYNSYKTYSDASVMSPLMQNESMDEISRPLGTVDSLIPLRNSWQNNYVGDLSEDTAYQHNQDDGNQKDDYIKIDTRDKYKSADKFYSLDIPQPRSNYKKSILKKVSKYGFARSHSFNGISDVPVYDRSRTTLDNLPQVSLHGTLPRPLTSKKVTFLV